MKKQCPVDFNFRLLLNDGSIRYLHCHTEVDTDQQHNIKRIFGISKDITAEVIAASKLQQAATVFNNTAEAIFITDANNVIISINPAYTQTTGYAEHEVLGKTQTL